MPFLTPVIKQISPDVPIILTFPGGGMQGISTQLTLTIDITAPAGVTLPINGTAVLTIINSSQYQFEDSSREKRINFKQLNQLQTIQFIFKIQNVHALDPSPSPLLLTACTFAVADGEGSKTCDNKNCAVKTATPLAKVKFLAKKRRR